MFLCIMLKSELTLFVEVRHHFGSRDMQILICSLGGKRGAQ